MLSRFPKGTESNNKAPVSIPIDQGASCNWSNTKKIEYTNKITLEIIGIKSIVFFVHLNFNIIVQICNSII